MRYDPRPVSFFAMASFAVGVVACSGAGGNSGSVAPPTHAPPSPTPSMSSSISPTSSPSHAASPTPTATATTSSSGAVTVEVAADTYEAPEAIAYQSGTSGAWTSLSIPVGSSTTIHAGSGGAYSVAWACGTPSDSTVMRALRRPLRERPASGYGAAPNRLIVAATASEEDTVDIDCLGTTSTFTC